MRTHGVPNMPDPKQPTATSLDQRGTMNGVAGIDPNSSSYQKADKSCSHLLPNGGQLTPAEQQKAIANALKFVQCLRTHGIPNMPDPIASGRGIALRVPAADPTQPQFESGPEGMPIPQSPRRSVNPAAERNPQEHPGSITAVPIGGHHLS